MYISFDILDQNSTGGSSYRVEVTSPTFRQVCPVRDHFDGTYLGCCVIDIATNPEPYNIAIYIQFVQFNAFNNFLGVHKLVWQDKFNSTRANRFEDATPKYEVSILTCSCRCRHLSRLVWRYCGI